MACGCFLKWWIYVSIILILIFGIVFEVVFIFLACGKFAEATNSKGGLIAIGTIFLVITLIVVIIGFCGICKSNTCLLVTYAIIAILMCAGFWVAFAFLKRGKNNVHKDIEKVCSTDEGKDCFIQDLDNVYSESFDSVFCTDQCKCKADRSKFIENAYTDAKFDMTNGVSVISNCPSNPTKSKKKALLSFLGWLEEEKRCSGICEKQKWYYFSDVNRGVPPKACRKPLTDYLDSKSYE